jgi:galactokinase
MGFVMPAAIDMGVWVGISKIPDPLFSVYSIDYNQKMVAGYDEYVYQKQEHHWFNYPLGVIKIMQKNGYKFDGVRITFMGNVPQGSGLSSSAALEIAVGFAIQQLYDLKLTGVDLAKIGRDAEHSYVGVKCGIMDQFISRMGAIGKALLIDCKSLEYRLVPLELKTAKLVITNSNVPHKLSSSQYNQRVAECEEAVKILSITKEGESLRDFTLEEFNKVSKKMPEIIRKRALHVISENQRVLDAEKALKEGNLKEFGSLMNQSHESLKVNYEVSSPELDWLTETARSIPGCYGSRMTGAGFGGCTVTLIESSAIQAYKDAILAYQQKFGYKAEVYESGVAEGAHVVWKKQ